MHRLNALELLIAAIMIIDVLWLRIRVASVIADRAAPLRLRLRRLATDLVLATAVLGASYVAYILFLR